MGNDAVSATRIHQVPPRAGCIHQVEETARVAHGSSCCCCSRRGAGLGPLGRHAERRHRPHRVFVILLDCCHRLAALVAALTAAGSEPEGVGDVRHLAGGVVEAGCRHVVADVRWQPVEEMCPEEHALRLPGWQQGQHEVHELPGTPIAELTTVLTAVDDSLAEIQRLGCEEVQQLGLEGPVGVGYVVNGVQDAADLLNHLLRESWQDQVEAQPGVSDVAAVEGGLRQLEPGASILGPEGQQFHFGQPCVLGPSWRKRRESSCVAVLATSSGEVVSRWSV